MMIIGHRIQQRLSFLNQSQSWLAREVGVRQSTISSLVRGTSYGTKHIHRIARALETTPEYLSGETGDPGSRWPDDQLSSRERRWLGLWRRLDPPDRQLLEQMLERLSKAGEQPAPTPCEMVDDLSGADDESPQALVEDRP